LGRNNRSVVVLEIRGFEKLRFPEQAFGVDDFSTAQSDGGITLYQVTA